MPSWPNTLPDAFLRDGFARTPQPNVISFGTEVGPGKVRRRTTARTKSHTFSMKMTLVQLNEFEAFFEDDLSDGAIPFDWTDPVAGDVASWRFDPGSPYSARETEEAGTWFVSMTIIRQP